MQETTLPGEYHASLTTVRKTAYLGASRGERSGHKQRLTTRRSEGSRLGTSQTPIGDHHGSPGSTVGYGVGKKKSSLLQIKRRQWVRRTETKNTASVKKKHERDSKKGPIEEPGKAALKGKKLPRIRQKIFSPMDKGHEGLRTGLVSSKEGLKVRHQHSRLGGSVARAPQAKWKVINTMVEKKGCYGYTIGRCGGKVR